MPKDLSKYLDIINLPRHISTRRAPMSISNRAAQFAPFAALTGYESSIREAARFTEQRIEPDEDQKHLYGHDFLKKRYDFQKNILLHHATHIHNRPTP